MRTDAEWRRRCAYTHRKQCVRIWKTWRDATRRGAAHPVCEPLKCVNLWKRTKTTFKHVHVCSSHFLSEKDSIKYCLLLLWARLKISCISRICRVWNNFCVHVFKTRKWRIICLIICNCIYSVLINCGWNNNVAVKIVACWNWNVFTSSWLDRHSDFVSTIHVRYEPLNWGESCKIVYSLSKSMCGSANRVSSVKLTIKNEPFQITVSDLTYAGKIRIS